VIGFGLNNITEGFAIAAPLVVGGDTPTLGFLGLTGLLAGGPTFLGTVVGYGVNSPLAFVLFLALAAGAIFYLIGEMFAVGRSLKQPVWSAWGVVVGFLVAYGTDVVLTVAGL
jgi:ZIP family zinc transporter